MSEFGFDAQVPSLPQGGGAVSGLGETYTPDLSTGTGTYTIRLDTPNGPNDIGPRLSLRYDTSTGNGPFGLGFSLPLPRLLRSASRRFPGYDDSDPLVLEGAGELVRLPGGGFRPQVDGGAWRVEPLGDGFRLTDAAGLYFIVGTAAEARQTDVDGSRVYAWHLERIEDALGNAVTFEWQRDGLQLYLASLCYGQYEIAFIYETRPDPLRWGRAGFLITTARRCRTIELRLPGSDQPLVRRWSLEYTPDPLNGCSLLTRVTLTGFDEAGSSLAAPPLALGYSTGQLPVLRSFEAGDEVSPPGLAQPYAARTELVDWDGNGLPDILSINPGGKALLWRNQGNFHWAEPRLLHEALPLFADNQAPLALLDMNGDGVADLVPLDRLVGYLPRQPRGSFAQPVNWSQVPAGVHPLDPAVRMVDLDGDGIVDIMAPDLQGFSLYYRDEALGFGDMRSAAGSKVPAVNLSDPFVLLADMTGDGSQDLVQITAGSVTYWPYLGNGRWDAPDEPVFMGTPAGLPTHPQRECLFLSDLDGDGCADLLYLDQDNQQVLYWFNCAGQRFSAQHTFSSPLVAILDLSAVRLADMGGQGSAGLLWSATQGGGENTRYRYLDFNGGQKPHLMNHIDSGVGLVTEIEYSTSTEMALADPYWATFLPFPLPVVSRLTRRESSTGSASIQEFHYHDGRYDGRLREFAGFGRVEEDQLADEIAPALRTITWYHNGIRPGQAEEDLSLAERRSLRAIRGRVYRQERSGLDGSPEQGLPYDRQEQEWVVVEAPLGGDPAQIIYIPRLQRTVRTSFERQVEPAGSITTTNEAWDEYNNITRAVETSQVTGQPDLTRTLRTETRYAGDPTGRFRQRAWRTRQFDGQGSLLADTITLYDHAPEGSLGAQGLVTGRLSLALTDQQVEEAYGAAQPDFNALGYFRRDESPGWWLRQVTYQRTEDAGGLQGQVTGPNGAVTNFVFDEFKTYPVRITDPAGNVTQAEYNYRACRLARLIAPGGSEQRTQFDALARPLAVIQPGDSPNLPTSRFQYITEQLPVQAGVQRRAISGQAETIDSREFFNGENRLLERRERDAVGEVVVTSQVYSGRGLLQQTYRPFRPSADHYQSPSTDLPHASYAYDALGRMTEQTNPDGSRRRLIYGPLLLEEWDEEDLRDDPDAAHRGTFTRTYLDITGRVLAIEENLAGRCIRSSYIYDVKGNLLAHSDANGNLLRTTFDCLGRPLRVERPESSTVTVYDAASSPVESRSRAGQRVLRRFDTCNRLIEVCYDKPDAVPAATLVYHDASAPETVPAGTNTAGGHLLKVEYPAGSVLLDYDERGRPARKRIRALGDEREFAIDYHFRADGQMDSVTYPSALQDGSRPVITYEYNLRGQLERAPGLIDQISYDAAGRRTRVAFANGIAQDYQYDPLTAWLVEMQISGPQGALRSTQYQYDRLGNLVQVVSPDPGLAARYAYDDLYRLVSASTESGETWRYVYDDAGNLLHKSDVGDYRYGEGGAPATCLTSAGGYTFTYTPSGQVAQAFWGQNSYDAAGRLVRIDGAGGVVEFAYDHTGLRVADQYSSPQAGRPALRLTPDPLFVVEDGRLIYHFSDGAGIVASQEAGGEVHFLLADHQGSVVLVSGADGGIIERRRYDPYGAMLEPQAQADILAGVVAFGYTGGVMEIASGLLYLNARYYHPRLGRFISPDSVIQDLHDPLAWSAYVYCRDNPLVFVDPSGESFWEAALAVVAIVALVAFSVCTLGLGTLALVGIGLAMVAGGVVGGLAAAKKGGDLGDILTGALVGAAVGGWAALGAMYAGGAVASGLGVSGEWGTILAGAVNGAVNGSATGFAAGFAGGRGSLDEMLNQMWAGALAGAMTGSLLAKWSMQQPQTLDQLKANLNEAVKPITQPPALSTAALNPSQAATWLNSVQQIPSNITSVLRDYALSQLTPYLSQSAVQTLVVDAMVGSKMLGYKNPFESDFSEGMWEKEIGGPLRREAPGLAMQKLTPLLA